MTTFTTTRSRCDLIIALIDDCLVEVDSSRRASGAGRAGVAYRHIPFRPSFPARSLP